MATIDFRFTYLTETPRGQVQRRAVLNHLVDRPEKNTNWVEATATLQKLWRNRLWALQKHDWTDSHIGTMYNCHPTFVMARPMTHTCHRVHICPFCYARAVAKRYDAFLAAWQAAQAAEPQAQFQLLQRKEALWGPLVEENLVEAKQLIVHRRGHRVRRFKTFGAVSNAWVVTKEGQMGILFQELHLCPAGYAIPRKVASQAIGTPVFLPLENEEHLVAAFSDTFRYHRSLMREDPRWTGRILDALKDARLAALHGLCREHGRPE